MAPRSVPLPPARTESAREFRSNFYCALCKRAYDRITDFEAHNIGYEHNHAVRARESRQLSTIGATPAERARKEAMKHKENTALLSENLQTKTAPAGEKRGFKDATRRVAGANSSSSSSNVPASGDANKGKAGGFAAPAAPEAPKVFAKIATDAMQTQKQKQEVRGPPSWDTLEHVKLAALPSDMQVPAATAASLSTTWWASLDNAKPEQKRVFDEATMSARAYEAADVEAGLDSGFDEDDDSEEGVDGEDKADVWSDVMSVESFSGA